MLISLLLALTLGAQEAPLKTGTITGQLAPVANTAVTKPMKMALLPGDYVNLYDGEVLRRQDSTWELFKQNPAYAQNKEAFLPLTQLVQSDAIQFVLATMRSNGIDLARLTGNSAASGKFEFKNVPQGEYKVLAYGSIGANDYVWQGWVNLDSAGTVTVLLKSTLP